MAVLPMKRPVITEAERRGKLNAEQAGEFIFNDFDDYIEAMGAVVRSSPLSSAAIAHRSAIIKSSTTVSHLAKGWVDPKTKKYRRTQQPRFSTMFGIASALGLEVTFRRRQR